jgi:hypothetical protein
MPVPTRERGPVPGLDPPALASLALYAALCLATALVWEPAHDEGTTWDQAVAHLPLAAGEPVAIERLYALAAGAPAHSSAEVLASLRSADGMHPPAYYLLMNRWLPATGGRRLLVALPVLALGAAALLALRGVAERVAPGPGAGERAMLLLAVSPWLVGHGVLARPYAMALAIFVLATAALLRWLSTPGIGSRALFAALSLLGLYTIYHYAFALAWQLSLLAAHAAGAPRGERRRELAALAATAAAIAVGYSPWVPSLLAHLELTRASWYFAGAVPAAEWPREAGRLLAGLLLGEEHRAVGRPVLAGALLALGLATFPFVARSLLGGRLAAEGRASRAFWATAPLLPALVAAADAWHGTHTLFVAKTGFALPVVLVLLVVRASHAAPAPALGRGIVGAWGALALAAGASAIWNGAAGASPIRSVAAHLRERAEPGHLVVVSTSRPTYVYPLLLALRDAGIERASVMYAPPELLRAEGAALAERAGARSLSLVNLAVTYDRSSVWDRALLRDVARRARESGFAAGRPGPGSAESPRSDGERRLWILSPVQVRYFPG